MLSFSPRDVLDEILNLIESVSEGFPSYSFVKMLIIKISRSALKLGHVGLKSRSLGQILEKVCVHSKMHSYDHEGMSESKSS